MSTRQPPASAATPRGVIASLGAGPHADLLRIARRTIEPYAARHGYDLALHEEIVDATRPASWSKLPIMRELVDRYDIVVWLDSDLVIVDPRQDIALELPNDSLLGVVEHHVGDSTSPNCGVMVLRGGAEAGAFLDAIWQLDRYTNHIWWENAAVCELLGYALDPPRPLASTHWRERTTLIAPRWNWIPRARARHAAIRHFPGSSITTRRALMRAATLEARLRAPLRRAH